MAVVTNISPIVFLRRLGNNQWRDLRQVILEREMIDYKLQSLKNQDPKLPVGMVSPADRDGEAPPYFLHKRTSSMVQGDLGHRSWASMES